ncbi:MULTISPECIES: hypothetical protein [unclassified Frankia]|uniref:hypothetical protein n=1 Tax=unclassified Frankia TaxID=2632575 RepID=UPI001EF472A9|nr:MULTISPECIES: hypothetical protein [unclassified Frankia]
MRVLVAQRVVYRGPLDGPDIAASLAEGWADVSMIVEVDRFDDEAIHEAIRWSRSSLRAAIHDIGDRTLGWDDGQFREAKVLTDAA